MENQWISITDKLPEQYPSLYLVARDDNTVSPSYYFFEYKCFSKRSDCDMANVTHWMPLPKPPIT